MMITSSSNKLNIFFVYFTESSLEVTLLGLIINISIKFFSSHFAHLKIAGYLGLTAAASSWLAVTVTAEPAAVTLALLADV